MCGDRKITESKDTGTSHNVGNTPPNRLGRVLAYAQTGILVGQTSGPAVGAQLMTFITQPHWLYLISGCVALTGGTLVALFVREVKQVAPGPWRLQWIGPLRELLRGSRLGPS